MSALSPSSVRSVNSLIQAFHRIDSLVFAQRQLQSPAHPDMEAVLAVPSLYETHAETMI